MSEIEDVKDETNELDEYFQNICNDKPIEYLAQMICPHLVGKEWGEIRKAGLLTLVTGNDTTTRMRLHMLLEGKPGTGKTEYMLWWRENLQGILINAELCSKTGLVGDARGKNVTAGLLADFDGNFVMADELDKMSMKDQNGLLQAMEEGQYIIVKGKHRQAFKAEVRVIGSTNDLDKIQRPLLDRFDFVYTCSTATKEDRAEQLETIVNSFMGEGATEYGKIVRGYVEWIGDFSPVIKPEDRSGVVKTLKKYLLEVKKGFQIEKVSYRSLELSILRIAWAMAKLKKKNINSQDVAEAIMLKHRILKNLYGMEDGD